MFKLIKSENLAKYFESKISVLLFFHNYYKERSKVYLMEIEFKGVKQMIINDH